jgi:hypothetical protein
MMRIRRLEGSELWSPETDLLDVKAERPYDYWWTCLLHRRVLKRTGLWTRFEQASFKSRRTMHLVCSSACSVKCL